MMESYWAGPIVIIGLALLGGLVTLERRLTRMDESKLGKADHALICEKSNNSVEAKLQSLEDLIEAKEAHASKFRHEMNGSVHQIAIKLEVMFALAQRDRKERLDDSNAG